MPVWAIADLHLSFGVPNKKMDVFGPQWINYTDKIKKQWEERIHADDLVLIAGDISWAMRPEEAIPDLEWIHQLPGTKVLIRGNHDYWWTSISKVEKILPSSLHIIQNNAFLWNDIGVAGARLWDSPEYNFGQFIDMTVNPKANLTETLKVDFNESKKIWEREIVRLEMSLKALNAKAKYRLVMTHYPPISADLQPSQVSQLLQKYQVHTCVFGHLHNVKRTPPLFGEKDGTRYLLTACDYLDFVPIKILD